VTVLCGVCNAENRDAAKFCKGCGRKIAQAWPQAAATPLAVGAGDATVLLGTRAPAPAPAPAPAVEEIHSMPAPLRPRIGNGRWIAGLAAGVVLMVLLAAWWGHDNRSREIPEPAAAPPAQSPVDTPVQAPEPAAGTAVEAASAPAASSVAPAPPLEVADKPDAAPAAQAAPAAAPKARKPVAKKQAAPAPAPVVEAVAPAPPPSAPEPVRLPTPQEACAGRNFIARAQCLAAQCARPEVAGHPQCEAVRRQQQIEEEKRNPSMAN